MYGAWRGVSGRRREPSWLAGLWARTPHQIQWLVACGVTAAVFGAIFELAGLAIIAPILRWGGL